MNSRWTSQQIFDLNQNNLASIGIRKDSVGFGIHCQWLQGSKAQACFCARGAGGVYGVGSQMEEGWGLTVWPVNSHPSVWKLVAGSVLVAALLPWSQSGPFYSRQMLGGRWWGPRYVRHPAPFLQFMWICVNWWFLLYAPVCFNWTGSEPEFCSGWYRPIEGLQLKVLMSYLQM